MRITFVISSLSAGGAERVISTMANYWAKKGWDITLITLYPPEIDFYELHPDVKRCALRPVDESSSLQLAIKNNLTRIFRLRSEIKKRTPDVVISFIDRINVLALLATWRLNLKVIVSERVHPAYHSIGRIWAWLRRTCYPWADVVVCQSAAESLWLKKNIQRLSPVVIPNPIHRSEAKVSGKTSLKDFTGNFKRTMQIVVAMGRLTSQKGFDLLLKAFARIIKAQSAWSLVIFGEGNERSSLECLARELGIADYVFLPGVVKNPMQLMRQADLFVLSSRYEGFPNALCEAMACGLPVISFDCPSGPREIVRDGVDGILVPPENVDALAEAMNRLMKNDAERAQLAARAPDVTERFSQKNIMALWEKAISNITGELYG